MSENEPEDPRPAQIETVRCLSCGARYAKPSSGGTVRANPGCPECAYVGWVLASEPHATQASPLRRGSPAAPVGVTALTPPK
jgi:phage FluMu protein Com